MKIWKEILHTNGSKWRAEVSIPILDKIDFKLNAFTRDKESYYLMIK
jgi:hypothetical protein